MRSQRSRILAPEREYREDCLLHTTCANALQYIGEPLMQADIAISNRLTPQSTSALRSRSSCSSCTSSSATSLNSARP